MCKALRRWIQEGAQWPDEIKLRADLWSLRPIVRPAVPDVKDRAWVRNPIDAFILQELEKNALRPADPAEKATLLRRATFDLHGLPPTPEEIDDFLADDSDDAYAQVIERLLASPRYGERWGRHWLDLASYADSHGFELDYPRPHAWAARAEDDRLGLGGAESHGTVRQPRTAQPVCLAAQRDGPAGV